MLYSIAVWVKANYVTLIEVIGLALLLVGFFSLFKVRGGFSKKGPFKLTRWLLFVFITPLLFIGAPWLAWVLMRAYILPAGETLKIVLSRNPVEVLVGIIGWLFILSQFLYRVIFNPDAIVSENAKKPLGKFKIPIPYIKLSLKFKRGNILLASAINETLANKTNFLSLYIKLNGLAPCDFLLRPEDFNKSRYKVGILISTDHYWTKSPNYNGDPARINMHSCIIDFLRRGNYLITAHDCHPWGEVGFFGPPNTVSLEVRPVRRHPITRGINIVRLANEEGSHRNSPIGPQSSDGIKKQKVLFNAEMAYVTAEAPEEITDLNREFPAAWLIKYKSKHYNIFYWYPAHANGILANEDFNTVIYNAVRYFLKKPLS